ncbi:MAG: Hpt domain-containing protein [Planctomycetota bacterium]
MLHDDLDRYSGAVNVDTLLDRCFGNLEFASRILDILSERCEPDIEAIEAAVQNEDFQQVYGIAHRLKGAFANASADGLSQIAEDLCQASKAMDAPASREGVSGLREGWDQLSDLMGTGGREQDEPLAPEQVS